MQLRRGVVSLAASRRAAMLQHSRAMWGVSPEPAAESLLVPLDVSNQVPLFDGATPTKV